MDNNQAYCNAEARIINIYLDKALAEPELYSAKKIGYIATLFAYLSTTKIKPLLNTANFVDFRRILLTKLHETSAKIHIENDQRLQHRLITIINDLFSYLVQDDRVLWRRSERVRLSAVNRLEQEIRLENPKTYTRLKRYQKAAHALLQKCNNQQLYSTSSSSPKAKKEHMPPPAPLARMKTNIPLRRSARLLNQHKK